MNPRINKLCGEIEKTKQKIAEFQTKLKGMEQQKTELENAEYVALIRELDMTPGELAAFLKKHTHGKELARPVSVALPIKTGSEVSSDKDNIKQ